MHVDLHCHSIFSDGTLSPTALAQQAAQNGVELWALTDHDELAGLAEAQDAANQCGLPWVSGVEISVSFLGRTVHIVGLHFDHQARALNQGLATMRAERNTRARKMAAKLEDLGVPDAYAGALRYVGNPALISRTHFARHLVAIGFCSHMQQVFDRYLGDGQVAYVEQQWASLEQALAWIHDAAGVAVIAHPGRYAFSSDQETQLIRQFMALGGQGIEVITSNHNPEQTARYSALARHYGLAASSGSDYHGPGVSRAQALGECAKLPDGLKPVWQLWH